MQKLWQGGALMANQTQTPAHPKSKVRRISFWVVIGLATLFLLVALLSAYPLIIVNWFPHDLWLAVRTDHVAEDLVHRLHSLALGVISWGMLLGVVLQIHRPEKKVSALLASLAVPIAIAVSEMLAGTYTVAGTAPFLILILIAIILHPKVKDIVHLPKWNFPMLGLAVVATLPWIMYAVGIGKAAHNVDGFELDHMTFMSALALVTILWGIIGASNQASWQYAAGASLVATASIGLQSLIFPGVLSGLSLPWAIVALVWCISYGSAAILRSRKLD
jgi:hypothetical protein